MFPEEMTLRDYIAIHAAEKDIDKHLTTGIESRVVSVNGLPGMPDATHAIKTQQWVRTREEARYAYADAMLLARKS